MEFLVCFRFCFVQFDGDADALLFTASRHEQCSLLSLQVSWVVGAVCRGVRG